MPNGKRRHSLGSLHPIIYLYHASLFSLNGSGMVPQGQCSVGRRQMSNHSVAFGIIHTNVSELPFPFGQLQCIFHVCISISLGLYFLTVPYITL